MGALLDLINGSSWLVSLVLVVISVGLLVFVRCWGGSRE